MFMGSYLTFWAVNWRFFRRQVKQMPRFLAGFGGPSKPARGPGVASWTEWTKWPLGGGFGIESYQCERLLLGRHDRLDDNL
jgi:hypothetical protein